jgi:hypothetical protein
MKATTLLVVASVLIMMLTIGGWAPIVKFPGLSSSVLTAAIGWISHSPFIHLD